MYDFEGLVFVEVEQVDFAKGVEIVARGRKDAIGGVLDLDVCYEGALSPASFALSGAPGGAVVAPPFAVGAVPERRVPDRYSSHTLDIISEAGGIVELIGRV